MPPERIALTDLLGTQGTALRSDIANRIAHGAVFIYPTETIYGIGGRADSTAVAARIYDIKQRSAANQMILLAATREHFNQLNLCFPDAAEMLAKEFWPGRVTLVLPQQNNPSGIAIRVSNHPFIIALSASFPHPLFSTSANISGTPYIPDPDVLFRTIGSKVDFFIDAGRLPQLLPSTIVKISRENAVTILREGIVSATAIFSAAATSF